MGQERDALDGQRIVESQIVPGMLCRNDTHTQSYLNLPILSRRGGGCTHRSWHSQVSPIPPLVPPDDGFPLAKRQLRVRVCL